MTASWRLIPLEFSDDSCLLMSKEEAVMNAVRDGAPPTLRFYSWLTPAVALGFFQKGDVELNLAACKKDGVDVFRRITGGGAVYKQPGGEINYSLIIREDDPMIPKDIEESYHLICGAVMLGLKKLGFETSFKPINDILLNGLKISGNAQTRVDNVLLQHGTILFDVDFDKMFSYLNIDEVKRKKKTDDVKNLVVGLRHFKPNLSFDEVEHAIIKGFEETFNINCEQTELSQKELDDAISLKPKYSDQSFISWR